MPEMTGARALVKALEAEGVDTVFALPGVQVMSIFDALHGSNIRLIATRHEQAATYMADGYARVTGKPGVALVVPGPGAYNAAAGLGTAYAASSPVLLISGQIASAAIGKDQGQLHEVDDQLDAFRPITKWNRRTTRVDEIPALVHESFRQMTTGRPRPVEIEIPSDTLTGMTTVELLEAERYPVPSGDSEAIAEAAQTLVAAERPAIWAGGGVLRARAGAELAAVAERLQAPVVTTQNAKGVLPPDHPLYVGVNYASIGLAAAALEDADTILVVGSRFLATTFDRKPGQVLIHIDADKEVIGKNHRTQIGIAADAKAALAALARAMRARAPRRAPDGRAARIKRTAAARLRALAPEQAEWVAAVAAALPDDAVVVSGMTNIGYWSHLLLPVPTSACYIASSYFGTLGYGFPTGLGAKVGAPSRPVVALCGDGGFMYAPGELATARQYGINLVAVVFDNGAYGASRWDQAQRYGDRAIGTEFVNPDWDKLADAFGVAAIGADTPAALTAALRQALAMATPVLAHVDVPLMAPPFQLPAA